MTSRLVSWDRLVRYVSERSTDIRYGDPILPAGSTGMEIAQLSGQSKLQVKVLEGAEPFSATASGRTESVKTLLGPLEPRDPQYSPPRGRPLPVVPTVFTKPGPAVAGHGEDIPIPVIAQQQCDYEGEFVIVIGKDAKNVKEEDALGYVDAYTVGNDVSARDWQREPHKARPVPQWSFRKSFDKYAPLGPALVATDILGNEDKQGLQMLVNGEARQNGNTSDLCFGVRKLVAYCSQGQTLQRGSLIMTGTPGGVRLFMKPPTCLQHGDEVVVEIERIGQLKNKLVFEE